MEGFHEIKVAFSSFGNRAGKLKYSVKHKSGVSHIFVDQRKSSQIMNFGFLLVHLNIMKASNIMLVLAMKIRMAMLLLMPSK